MKTIIMIDDDESILDVSRLIFERAGYAVETFSNGQCIVNNSFEEPDVFLIDKQLSGMDGLDLCRLLKRREPKRDTPVIIFSASTHIEGLARDAGADAYLEKPFKIKDLLALIETQLNKNILS